MKTNIKVDNKESLRRKKKQQEEDEEQPRAPAPISNPVEKVLDLAFNPTRDKIREVTIVDRMQGRLLPQLDMINAGRTYVIEIALYRQNRDTYKKKFKKEIPTQPDLLDEFIFRTAQWQKSVAGQNLERAIDIALAETEARSEEGEDRVGADAWRE